MRSRRIPFQLTTHRDSLRKPSIRSTLLILMSWHSTKIFWTQLLNLKLLKSMMFLCLRLRRRRLKERSWKSGISSSLPDFKRRKQISQRSTEEESKTLSVLTSAKTCKTPSSWRPTSKSLASYRHSPISLTWTWVTIDLITKHSSCFGKGWVLVGTNSSWGLST